MGFDDLRQQSIAVQEQQYAAEPQSLMDRMPLFKDLTAQRTLHRGLVYLSGRCRAGLWLSTRVR